jgi:hypothetical protein
MFGQIFAELIEFEIETNRLPAVTDSEESIFVKNFALDNLYLSFKTSLIVNIV